MARNVETRTQSLRKAKQRIKDKRQGQDRPYFGFIKEYNAEADTTIVDSHGGRRILTNPQPHIGLTAWMRAAPEAGMGSLLITRSDAEEPEHMRYWQTDAVDRLLRFRTNVATLTNGTGELVSLEAFRPLHSGELDFASRGGCSLFMGSSPHMDMRAGIITLNMDQNEAVFSVKSPLHIKRGYQNSEATISDEERWGVVKRQENSSFVDSFFPDTQGRKGTEAKGFAKEHLMRLTNAQPSSPAVLLDKRSGNAMDDNGMPYVLEETGLALRARAEYFTPADTSVLAQLDENGNFKLEHPIDATVGVTYVLPSGSFKSRIGLNFENTVGRNEQIVIGADRIHTVGNDDIQTIRNTRKLTVGGDDIHAVTGESTDNTIGNKTSSVGGVFSLAANQIVLTSPSLSISGDTISIAGNNSIENLTGTKTTIVVGSVTIKASQIILEAPMVSILGNLQVSGTIKSGG